MKDSQVFTHVGGKLKLLLSEPSSWEGFCLCHRGTDQARRDKEEGTRILGPGG